MLFMVCLLWIFLWPQNISHPAKFVLSSRATVATQKFMKSQSRKLLHREIALAGVALLSLGSAAALAQPAESQVMTTTSDTAEAPKIPNDHLDSLVAPIALYPDPLLAQTLAASTYPLEIIQLQQWMQQNKSLKGKALADAVAKQKWDPSVQSMAGIPDAVQRLAGNIQWTTDLGNAFLAQQQDLMNAVQRMRAKAQSKGALKTSQQQTVETQTVQGGKQVIVIQQPSKEVVYIPSYDPVVVYGAPAYPYYPYAYPGYVPGMGLAFGAGIVAGAAWANNWGNCDWNNGGDININNNNNFNRNTNINNIQGGNRVQGGSGKWQHQPQHRGNAPYGDRGTANRYGGNARQQPGGAGGAGGAGGVGRPGGAGGAGSVGKPGGAGGVGKPGGAGGIGKPGGAAAGNRPGGGGGITAGGSRPSTKPATRPSGGGANSIGSRDLSGGSRGGGGGGGSPSFSSRGGGFGGGSGSTARASSSRGGRSMGGGGMSRGGGGGRRR
jgi:hypothetical protein